MSSPGSSTKPRKSAATDAALKGWRILVVEDSPVVGPFTADLLAELGCEVVGPAPNMAVARELIDSEAFDFPLCEMLDARSIPFILTSGYADWQMPEKLEDRPRLQKPYTIDQIEKALASLFS